jgi:hypothetical protein
MNQNAKRCTGTRGRQSTHLQLPHQQRRLVHKRLGQREAVQQSRRHALNACVVRVARVAHDGHDGVRLLQQQLRQRSQA